MGATREVGQAIASIQTGARDNVQATASAVDAVMRSTELTEKSGGTLKEIVSMVDRTADQVRSIATASEQQSAASEQISRSTEEVNMIAQDTAEIMSRSASAVTELAGLAGDLRRLTAEMRA